MMDYEGIVRASGRTHAPRTRVSGALGVVPVATPAAQQPRATRAPQGQFMTGACFPVPMGMR